jgi:hypothetical protein
MIGCVKSRPEERQFADVPTKFIDLICPAGGPKGGKSHFTVLKYI